MRLQGNRCVYLTLVVCGKGEAMSECTNNCCTDPEMAEARHGLSRRERLQRDPDYGDWLYEQEKDRRMEEEEE